jgi:hypothetical protein
MEELFLFFFVEYGLLSFHANYRYLPVELIDTQELINTAKHMLTQTDTGVSISWTGARTY